MNAPNEIVLHFPLDPGPPVLPDERCCEACYGSPVTYIILPPPADPDAHYVVHQGEVVGVLEVDGHDLRGHECGRRCGGEYHLDERRNVEWWGSPPPEPLYRVRPLPVEPEPEGGAA